MDYDAELPGTFAAENTSPCMRRVIGGLCVAYSLATFAVLPLAHLPGPVVPAITTTFGAGVLLADLCTSFLLLIQFRVAPSWSLLLLAAAYCYSGAMAVLHVLTFPGAWIPEAVLVGTPQSVGWLFIFWTLGYPLLVLAAIVAEARGRHRVIAAQGINHAIAIVFGIVLAVILALALVATTGVGWMPKELHGNVFASWANTAQWTSVGITLTAFVALVLVTRGRNVLYGWLGLALIAFMAFNVLAVAGGARYTIGWDLSRISGFLSASLLLVFFLGQFARLHYSLATALQLIRRQAERALSDSHERMHALCDAALDGIITMDHAGQITDFNRAAEQIFGYHRSDVIGQALADVVIPPAWRQQHRSGLARYLATGDAVMLGKRLEVTGQRADGSLIAVELSINRMPGDSPSMFAGFVRDITDRKQAEAALRESEERFRVMADNVPLIVWLHDAEGQQQFVNHTFCAYFGVSREEMQQDRWQMLTHPDDRQAYIGAFHACVRERRLFHAEVRARRADGQWRWLESWSQPRFGPEGAYLGHVGTSADVTERKQAEEALRQQREWFEVTLASIGDGVMTTDTTGCITFMNPVAAALTGWSVQEALGQPIERVFPIVHESTRQPLPSPVARVLEAGHVVHLANHTVLRTRDGRDVVIADSGAPIRSADGTLLGVVLVFQDVSAQQQMEAELFRARKIESVGVLAGGIAHDFNNLLTGILGNISLAKRLAGEQQTIVRRLAEAEKACERATALTYQLLTFAKGGAPVRETVSMRELVVESVGFALHGANVRAEFHMATDLWPVDIDAGQISQVLHNVVLNAVQAMPEGGTIRVRADNVVLGAGETLPLPAGRYITVAVQDTGVGIPRALLPNVFDPYVTTKAQGSGLGLATAYAIMRKHDGHITVESQEGVGTTVCLYQPASSQPLAPSLAPPGPPLVGSGRILVMDDEEMICELLDALLSSIGHEVICVRDGTEVLAVYQQARASGQGFAAVILDHTIPGGMGGVDTMTRLRALDPQVKAVLSSGYANGPVMANWAEYGFRGVIPKPYTLERLQEALARLFQKS